MIADDKGLCPECDKPVTQDGFQCDGAIGGANGRGRGYGTFFRVILQKTLNTPLFYGENCSEHE